MIWSLLKRKKANQALVANQYELITEAARAPVFYENMDVPDTVMGRFEMITIHLVLYLRRTGASSGVATDIAQEIVDAFFEDVDHSIRELGIGDMGVPKRMKKFARMFYGRLKSYGQALDDGDISALDEALRRNIYPEPAVEPPALQALAAWTLDADQRLKDVSDDEIAAGQVSFPEPGQG
ncbi:ubiquinol-cytochrome C chaperone family protein [uncultured Hoeflea sp.]|uniref:ubiquinol-cytochrome C chaperone family protein n=1 Tax=uncultured Hoeflea sp. TaxID=538666 RepID=UPI002630A7D1|nr:ubiquinol-cytochrome C chaperone family protein [uncultured Hoeflea sp.]